MLADRPSRLSRVHPLRCSRRSELIKGAFQAKTRFGELLDRVARGEEIVITRHEKPVARLVPEGGANLAHIGQAIADLRAGRSAMAKRRGFKPLTDQEIKKAIEAGRP